MEPAREPERPIYTVIPEIQVGRPGYIRWQLTPNGYPWPDKSGYLFGYEQGSMGGRSNLKIDCTEYASDVLVKVYDHRFSPPKAVRTIFIKSYDQFMVAKLVAGEYDVRYQDLASWSISESDTIAFSERTSETPLPNGDVEIKHFWHDQRITLYRVFNPENPIDFQPITEDQFQ